MIGIAALALAACVSPEERAAMDRQRCAGFGFAPGTDGFANCMMQATQQREAEQAARQRQAEQNRVISQQMEADRAAAARARGDAAAEADRSRFMREFNSGGATSGLGTPGFTLPTGGGMNCAFGVGMHAGSMVCH
jgi:hypothetical protein